MRRGGRLLVVGFGNPLMADDGVGHAVVTKFLRAGPPGGVRAEEGGSDALQLGALWSGEPEVWLVDALATGAAPGTIHRVDHEALLSIRQHHVSAHRLSLPESLLWLNLAFPEMRRVHYRLWGIEPERLSPGEGLSPVVERGATAVAIELEAACSRGS